MSIIDKPSDYFNTKLYTGNGSTQSITSLDFQPDLNWTKQRNVSQDHTLTDSIRGVGKLLFSSDSAAEYTDVNSLTSFNSDGFSVGTSGYMNTNSNTYASWNWLAGGTASSNTNGSITSSVSANTTSGFSIVSYTGTGANATIGHGLNSAPKMVLVKDRDNGTYSWHVYHVGLGATKTIYLDLTNTPSTSSIYWNNTAPTSSVFSVGTSVTTNNSGDNFIAYCFADTSMSKMGSYTGNGSTDGTFVYTGFKPAWVMLKRTNTTGSWILLDNKRSTINVADDYLLANSSNAEAVDSTINVDFVSNGFKFRNTPQNESGNTLIYMCFAENPFVSSTGVPATAR